MSVIPTYGEMRSRAEKIQDAQLKASVLAGLGLLQEKHGASWVEHIDCATLDLTLSESCVLGQVYGDYDEGREKLGLNNRSAATYGFFTFGPWGFLQEAWRTVLCGKIREEQEMDFADWKYEVANGDTKLGLDEWVEQRDASDDGIDES